MYRRAANVATKPGVSFLYLASLLPQGTLTGLADRLQEVSLDTWSRTGHLEIVHGRRTSPSFEWYRVTHRCARKGEVLSDERPPSTAKYTGTPDVAQVRRVLEGIAEYACALPAYVFVNHNPDIARAALESLEAEVDTMFVSLDTYPGKKLLEVFPRATKDDPVDLSLPEVVIV